MALSEKLSEATGLSHREEFLLQDQNGKLTMVGREIMVKSTAVVVRLFLALSFSLIGAGLFRIQPTLRVFLAVGAVTVAANLVPTLTYARFQGDKKGETAKNYFSLRSAILLSSLIVRYSFLYAIFALLFNDFQLPVRK